MATSILLLRHRRLPSPDQGAEAEGEAQAGDVGGDVAGIVVAVDQGLGDLVEDRVQAAGGQQGQQDESSRGIAKIHRQVQKHAQAEEHQQVDCLVAGGQPGDALGRKMGADEDRDPVKDRGGGEEAAEDCHGGIGLRGGAEGKGVGDDKVTR